MANYGVKLGLKDAIIFPITAAGSATTNPTYGSKIDWPGIKSITLTPQSSKVEVKGDDRTIYTFSTIGSFEGTLEISSFPVEIKEKIFNFTKSSNGTYYENLSAQSVECCLAFEVSSSDGPLRFQYFRVKFERPGFSSETLDSTSPSSTPYELNFTAMALRKSDIATAHMLQPPASGSSGAKTEFGYFKTKPFLKA